MRCPRRPSLRTIPLRRLLSGVRPARPRPPHSSVALAVFRLADAMRDCLMCGHSSLAGSQSNRAAYKAAAKRLLARSTCLRPLVQAPIGETGRSRSRATRHIKRHRFTGILHPVDPLPEPGHAPSRSLARCSATQRLEPSRPGRASGPSLLLARRRSWGSYPSQVCSR
jgi:hypothetical protein